MRKLVLILFLSPCFLYSQITKSSNDVLTENYLDVLDVIKEYTKNVKFSKKSHYRKFIDLFDDSAIIYNDILPSSSYTRDISVIDYRDQIRTLERKRTTIDYEVLDLGDFIKTSDSTGMIDVIVLLKKSFVFNNDKANLIYDDEKEYVTWEYGLELKFDIRYTIRRDTIKGQSLETFDWEIHGISSNSPKKKLVAYVPFIKPTIGKASYAEKVNSLVINGQIVTLDGDKIFHLVAPSLDKSDVPLVYGQETDYKFTRTDRFNSDLTARMIFRTKFPAGITYGILMSDEDKVLDFGTLPEGLNIGSSSYKENSNWSIFAYPYEKSLGDRGGALPGKVILSIGGKYQLNRSTISLNNSSFTSVDLVFDEDNTLYERTSNISNINEEITISHNMMMLAIKAEIDFAFSDPFSKTSKRNASAGLMADIALNSQINSEFSGSADALYTGYYEDLFGLTIGDDEQFDYYDLGSYGLGGGQNSTPLNPIDMDVKPFSILDLGLYLSTTLYKQKNGNDLFLCLSLSRSISNSDWAEKSNDNVSISSSEFNSILSVSEKFNIQQRDRFSIGLIYKF